MPNPYYSTQVTPSREPLKESKNEKGEKKTPPFSLGTPEHLDKKEISYPKEAGSFKSKEEFIG